VLREKEQLKKALRGLAEDGVPEGSVDLRAVVRERVAGRPRLLRVRLRPRRRLGSMFAVLTAILLAGTVAYATSDAAYDAFRSALPGITEEEPVGALIDERQTAHDAVVTLERAYADTEFVVVTFTVRDLQKDRRVTGLPADIEPVVLPREPGEPRKISETWPEMPGGTRLTDERGGKYRVTAPFDDLYSELSEEGLPDPSTEAVPYTVVFAAPEGTVPAERRGFRLEVPLDAWIEPSALSERLPVPEDPAEPQEIPDDVVQVAPVGDEPFVFRFEVPVRPVPVVEADQTVEANGVQVTLDRVENSPGRPYAVFCAEPLEDEYDWELLLEKDGLNWGDPMGGHLEARRTGDGCWQATLYDRADSYDLTVTELVGFPRGVWTEAPELRRIQGPWKFRVEVPGSS